MHLRVKVANQPKKITQDNIITLYINFHIVYIRLNNTVLIDPPLLKEKWNK